jgi:hypothetical protein
MGLDLMEVLLEAEEEFDVKLPSDGFPDTVGGFYDRIIDSLREQRPERFDADSDYPDQVWEQLKAMLVNQLALNPDDVVRSAHWVRDLDCL